jgi:hypothetical protein
MVIGYFRSFDLKKRISFLNGYQKIAIRERKNEVSMPMMAAITPPPSPGPIYRRFSKNMNEVIIIFCFDQ